MYFPYKIIITSIISLNKFKELLSPYEFIPKDVINKIILSIYDSWFPCDTNKKMPSNCLKRWIDNIYQYGNIRHCESVGCHTISKDIPECWCKCLYCKKSICAWACKKIYIRLCKKCYPICFSVGFKCEGCKKQIFVSTKRDLPGIKINECKYCKKTICDDCFVQDNIIKYAGGCYDCYVCSL